MTHPATAPTLPCPARWPAMPPTIAPLIHPLASAAAGASAIPRMAVQRISSFMAVLQKKSVAATSLVAVIGSRQGVTFPGQDYVTRRPDVGPCRQPLPNL